MIYFFYRVLIAFWHTL